LGALLTPVGLPNSAVAQDSEPIAIIVHPSNPIADLSLDEVRRLYLGSTTIFDNNERVVLLESSADRTRFYRVALGMGEDRLKRHWIGRVFAGQAGSPPQEIRTDDELRRYVATHPGAIAFVRAGDGDRSTKIVSIDGLRPADDGYPIR